MIRHHSWLWMVSWIMTRKAGAASRSTWLRNAGNVGGGGQRRSGAKRDLLKGRMQPPCCPSQAVVGKGLIDSIYVARLCGFDYGE